MHYLHSHFTLIAILCGFIAMMTAIFMNPLIIKLAYKKHLTDIPNHRKLQKKPIPVLGGMSVYLALVVGLFFCNFFYPTDKLYVVTAALSVMFFLGLFDDLLDLHFLFKFFIQFGVIFLLWTFGYRIDTFAGLFGVTHIPMLWSCLLSMFVGVGLMNALNMIDGVDGLASGLGIVTSTICGAYFLTHHDPLFALLSVVLVGALIPFFICNVFSRKYKMFIGDSGSLILGTLAYVFTCRIIHTPIMDWNDQYCVAMLIAVYAIPVFDTLRVMSVRIMHGISPFKADKTHLHHMLLVVGYPHIMVTIILLAVDILIVAVWYLTSLYMRSINGQFFVVLVTAIIMVMGMYGTLKLISIKKPVLFDKLKGHSRAISQKTLKIRKDIRNLIDGNTFRNGKIKKKKNRIQKLNHF